MLIPEELDPKEAPAGTFVDLNRFGEPVSVTAVPAKAFADSACNHCVFDGNCRHVRCHEVLWATRETFNEYLQLKLLK